MKYYSALCGELALEEAMDQSADSTELMKGTGFVWRNTSTCEGCTLLKFHGRLLTVCGMNVATGTELRRAFL
jgi:hypothetical protein